MIDATIFTLKFIAGFAITLFFLTWFRNDVDLRIAKLGGRFYAVNGRMPKKWSMFLILLILYETIWLFFWFMIKGISVL